MYEVLNDHVGKLVNAHLLLKYAKNSSLAIVNHDENLNDHIGKFVSFQLLLNELKK